MFFSRFLEILGFGERQRAETQDKEGEWYKIGVHSLLEQ